MSKVVKVALPIIGGIVGTFFGMPEVGYAIGGYLGGRSYGGGNTGGLYGAAGAVAGNYLGGAASNYLSGMGGATAGSVSPELSQSAYQGFSGAQAGAMAGAGTGAGFSPELSQTAYQGVGDSSAGETAGYATGGVNPEFDQTGYANFANSGGMGGGGSNLTASGDYAPATGPSVGLGTAPAATPSSSQNLMQRLGLGRPSAGASGGGGGGGSANSSGLFGTGIGARDVLSIYSGLSALQQSEQLKKQSDPFAQYREGYGAELAALERNPASISSRPGYQAGLQAIQRAGAAQGYTGSGNMAASLAKYGGDFYNQEAARLAYLAGSGQVPGAGQAQGAALAGQGLASIGYGAAGIFDQYRDPNQTQRRYGP